MFSLSCCDWGFAFVTLSLWRSWFKLSIYSVRYLSGGPPLILAWASNSFYAIRFSSSSSSRWVWVNGLFKGSLYFSRSVSLPSPRWLSRFFWVSYSCLRQALNTSITYFVALLRVCVELLSALSYSMDLITLSRKPPRSIFWHWFSSSTMIWIAPSIAPLYSRACWSFCYCRMWIFLFS